MRNIKQPVGVKLQTNVAFIKYKVENKKFEIACYKNKAINWRNGVEKNLEEVLQSDQIYINAAHGTMANKKDLKQFFPDMSQEEIIKLILEKGDLQVGEKERDVQIANIQNDIINIISEKCCHPVSKRPFSFESIKQAVKDIQFPITTTKPSKSQASLCIKALQEKYELGRAEMRIKISFSNKNRQEFLQALQGIGVTDPGMKEDQVEMTYVIEPYKFKILNELVKKDYGDAIIEIQEQNIIQKEAVSLEDAGTVELKINQQWLSAQKSTVKEDDDEGQKKPKTKQKKNKGRDQANKDKEVIPDSDEEVRVQKTAQEEHKEELKEGQKRCTTCQNAIFDNMNDFRCHYKSDWHIFNIKRKAEKKLTVNQQDYMIFELDSNFK